MSGSRPSVCGSRRRMSVARDAGVAGAVISIGRCLRGRGEALVGFPRGDRDHLLVYSYLQFRGCLGHVGIPNPEELSVFFGLWDSASEAIACSFRRAVPIKSAGPAGRGSSQSWRNYLARETGAARGTWATSSGGLLLSLRFPKKGAPCGQTYSRSGSCHRARGMGSQAHSLAWSCLAS